MEIPINCKSFGIREQTDPTEVALALIDTEEGKILEDLASGCTEDEKITFVISEVACPVFLELGWPHRPGKDEELRSGYTPDRLRHTLRRDWTWVVCQDGLALKPHRERTRRPKFIMARRFPHTDFRHVIEIRFVSSTARIIVDGEELYSAVSCANRRFYADLVRLVDKAAKLPPGQTKTRIELPDTREGITIFSQEMKWLNLLLAHRVRGYCPPQGSRERQVLRILLNHSDEGVVVSGMAQDNLRAIIRASTEMGKPVPISLTVAHGMRAPNPLKFTSDSIHGAPTAAWAYNVFELALMDREVRTLYQPGLHFYVFEEGYLFRDLADVPLEIVERNVAITNRIIRELAAPVMILPMLSEHFPEKEVVATAAAVTDPEVFAMLCSVPEMKERSAMDLLYTIRDKPFARFKREMPALWAKARNMAEAKNRRLAWRKKTGLFPRLIAEATGEKIDGRVVDAAITEKEGRICFKLTGEAMFNHGAAVIERDTNGRFACWVVPEYRLAGGHFCLQKRVRPIRRVSVDFGESGIPLLPDSTWCYEVAR